MEFKKIIIGSVFLIFLVGIYKLGQIIGKETIHGIAFYNSVDRSTEDLIQDIFFLLAKEGFIGGALAGAVGFIYYCLSLLWLKSQPDNSHLVWLFIVSIIIGCIGGSGAWMEAKNINIPLKTQYVLLSGGYFGFSFGMGFSVLHFVYYYLKPLFTSS